RRDREPVGRGLPRRGAREPRDGLGAREFVSEAASGQGLPCGVVSLLTDFGPGSVYVGQMHATIARLAPAVRVIDLAHDVPFASTEAAAYLLRRSHAHFPRGTVHVVVVDPGVGTERAILAARA